MNIKFGMGTGTGTTVNNAIAKVNQAATKNVAPDLGLGRGQVTDASKNIVGGNTGGGGGGTGGSGGSASSSSGYGGVGYMDYLSAAMAARQEAMRRANEALDAQGRAIEQRYNNQLEQVGQDYQKLRNQSEVNRYKALRNLRETQANRGLLNSGAGRQENLNVSTAYGNNLNEIGIAENNERNQIQQAINEMWANIAAQKAANEANITGDFTSSLIGALQNGLYTYNPQMSDYYNAAMNAAGNVYSPAPAVSNGQISGLSPYQAYLLYQDDNQASWLNKLNNVNYLKNRI